MKVVVINDLEPDWKGEVRPARDEGSTLPLDTCSTLPGEGIRSGDRHASSGHACWAGDYTLVAELAARAGSPVRSLRDFKVVPVSETQ